MFKTLAFDSILKEAEKEFSKPKRVRHNPKNQVARLRTYLEKFHNEEVDWSSEDLGATTVDLAIDLLVSLTIKSTFYDEQRKDLEKENKRLKNKLKKKI